MHTTVPPFGTSGALGVISKAKTACELSEQQIEDHFADVGKMVSIGSGAEKEISDIMLTRYACYLIAQNGNPRKEKIAFAQSYIMEKGIKHKTPVFTATNFLESMIDKPKPNRAEINDIVSTLNQGGSGIVLAAETAIGKYPVDCVRIISRIIKEHKKSKYLLDNSVKDQAIEYLLSLSMDGIIKPHGSNELINQVIYDIPNNEIKDYPNLLIDEKYISDVIQICEGVYTPLTGFMNKRQIDSVLTKNKLLSGECWTLPIILQVDDKSVDKAV